MKFTKEQIVEWLLERREFIKKNIATLDQIEIDYYDMFFDVHAEILEVLWIQVMEE